MSDKVKKSIMVQGSILAMAGIISKIIGFIYRVPMANILGNSGNGIYSISFGLYNIALTLSSYSMPLAVSKLVSARLAKKENKNAVFLFSKALILAAISGAVACIVLFCGAEFFAKAYNTKGLEMPLRVLAPTTFVVAILGTSRGYFQGHKNMLPTALSQILEQIANAVVSVIAASMCVRMCKVEGDKAAFGAMGGTMGTLAGAVVAVVTMGVIFYINRAMIREEKTQDDELTEDNIIVIKAIFLTVLPIIISQTIYQLGYTLDDFLFSNLMHAKGFADKEISSLQGVFNTQYNQMINLPTAIASSMAAATLPSVVASYTIKDFENVHKKINQVVKINMIIAIPSFVGLAVLAEPIMTVLFPGLMEYHPTAVLLLETGSFAVVCYALSTLTTSVLQGCDKMRTPVINSGISLFIHVLLIELLVKYTNLGVFALVIGNVSFPLLTCIINSYCVKKLLNYKFDLANSFIKPFMASLVMGLGIFGIYTAFEKMLKFDASLLGSHSTKEIIFIVVALMFSIILGMAIYAVMLFILKAFSYDEAKAFPIIGKFVRKYAGKKEK